MAMKHLNGACFGVEDIAVEQPRALAFEISPTGPIIGYRMSFPAAEALEIEKGVMGEMGLTPEMFRDEGRLKVKGSRRALRVQPTDTAMEMGTDEHGFYVQVSFSLPPGSFATVLMEGIL
jgi:tRNA pseudouridine13 synthase